MSPRHALGSGPAVMAALLLFTAGAPGCRTSGRVARPGDTYVLVAREATPQGLRERRETWTLADTAQGRARFRVEREDRALRDEWRSMSAEVSEPPRRVRRRWVRHGELERLRVPAGEFRCRRSVHSREEPEGRIMRVDEWWAAGVPVPVQRWTRWEGLPERQRLHVPRHARELLLGAEWTVLERAPRP